jgi:hypothetical protein
MLCYDCNLTCVAEQRDRPQGCGQHKAQCATAHKNTIQQGSAQAARRAVAAQVMYNAHELHKKTATT